MAVKALGRATRLRLFLVAGLLVALLVALHLMSSAVQNTAELSRLFVPLLLFSIVGLTILLVLIVVDVVGLVRARRYHEPGSRLTVRMVWLFAILSLLPAGVVYSYSMQFLTRGIDSWFDVEIDKAMQDALELGRSSLDLHKRNLQQITANLIDELQGLPNNELALNLGELRRSTGATELAVMEATGRTLISNNANPGVLVADAPDPSVLQQVRAGEAFIGLTPYGEDGLLHVRVVMASLVDSNFVLQALFPLTQRVSELSSVVQEAFSRYKELAYLRQSLKFSFSLTLALVLLFSIFAAVWMAIVSARRLVSPISDLAVATRAVAEGDYSTQLVPPRAKDELAFLVASFNGMTRRISQARDAAAESQRQVEAQRAYLETVLSHLSTGVMAFDHGGRLRTANAAADHILQLDLEQGIDQSLTLLFQGRTELQPLVDAVSAAWASSSREWEQQIDLVMEEGRMTLRLVGTPLPLGDDTTGWLIMIEDMTALIQGQRNSAWGEVARRLAHEIKNPLTPIQLSAERIRRRYLERLTPDEGEVLDRATHTIVQQVDALKTMVNAFSDYARPSRLEARPVLFDRLVGEVVELYRAAGGVQLQIELAAPEVRVKADGVKLRQVVHNLVKNALEAVAETEAGLIHLTTRQIESDSGCLVELVVEDNGPGFDRELLGQVFDPYVTTKTKGTGLGLAIVRKIVEEHRGTISVGQSDLGGGKVMLLLPECVAVEAEEADEQNEKVRNL